MRESFCFKGESPLCTVICRWGDSSSVTEELLYIFCVYFCMLYTAVCEQKLICWCACLQLYNYLHTYPYFLPHLPLQYFCTTIKLETNMINIHLLAILKKAICLKSSKFTQPFSFRIEKCASFSVH